MSYSTDLRQRVLAAVDRGMARAEVVTTFQVSVGSIKRWLRQRRTTGTRDAHAPPGRPATIPSDHDPALIAQVTAHPDATLQEHCDLWRASHGVLVSRWTMSRAMEAVKKDVDRPRARCLGAGGLSGGDHDGGR